MHNALFLKKSKHYSTTPSSLEIVSPIIYAGDALLTPTRIYVKAVLDVISKVNVKGISHITGGGFYENIPRALPERNCLSSSLVLNFIERGVPSTSISVSMCIGTSKFLPFMVIA